MTFPAIIAMLFALSPLSETGSLEQRLDSFLTSPACPNLSGVILLEQEQQVRFHRAYGHADRAKKVPMSVETPFCVASISKQFTAAAILELAEMGKLNLEDPISDHLEGVPARLSSITIHHLLCHMGGLRQVYAADGVKDREKAVGAVLRGHKDPIGKKFQYTNDGYSLLAAIVEKVGGKPFEEWMKTHLFQPGGLGSTRFWGFVDLHDPRQIAYIPEPGNEQWEEANWGYRGGTGMITTTSDLHRWTKSLQKGTVLNPTSVEKLWAPHVPLSIGHAGYGWFRTKSPLGRPLLWTRGTEDMGHNALVLWFLEEETLLIIATNAGNIDGTPYAKYLGEALEPLIFP